MFKKLKKKLRKFKKYKQQVNTELHPTGRQYLELLLTLLPSPEVEKYGYRSINCGVNEAGSRSHTPWGRQPAEAGVGQVEEGPLMG